MNWMNGICFLLGAALGAEAMYCIMKYRFDKVAENINKLHVDLSEALKKNGELIDKWGVTIEHWNDTINLNGQLIDLIDGADKGKRDVDNV